MSNQVTVAGTIIEAMPFADELIAWCKTHPEFLRGLKNIYAEKFISLGAIVTSHSPYLPEDEVIGVYTYDYIRRNPLFKQDFIINKGKLYKEFILFTRNPKGGSSKYVKDINEFFATYGKGKFYINSHHVSLEELPIELRERGTEAMALAEKMKGYQLGAIPQSHINKIHGEIKAAKKNNWYKKIKLSDS